MVFFARCYKSRSVTKSIRVNHNPNLMALPSPVAKYWEWFACFFRSFFSFVLSFLFFLLRNIENDLLACFFLVNRRNWVRKPTTWSTYRREDCFTLGRKTAHPRGFWFKVSFHPEYPPSPSNPVNVILKCGERGTPGWKLTLSQN